jgi:hybrid cluster-associated redox disulfide protein
MDINNTENADNTSENKEDVMEVYGIRADMTLGDIMNNKPEIIPILMDAGMHCISCPAALMETLEEASMVHGIPIEELMQYIKESLEKDEKA